MRCSESLFEDGATYGAERVRRMAAADPEEKDTAAAATSTPETFVYRAGYVHETIPLGLYTNEAAARAHCEATVSSEHPASVALLFDWIGEDDDPEEPRELIVRIGDEETTTGYTVTRLEVATAYDPDAEL
ncbi:hypothetical protein AB0M87_02500 [Streptomyces sp. NPDC051320]|uniref:hypothetical protein n=1 Tax=Streptomyces sp. NPDC051320 TaxID=3154644 RepID=UPI003424D606